MMPRMARLLSWNDAPTVEPAAHTALICGSNGAREEDVRRLSQTAAMAARCLAAFGAAAAMLALAVAEAHASCAPVSDRWKLATVIVDARALEGPTATG